MLVDVRGRILAKNIAATNLIAERASCDAPLSLSDLTNNSGAELENLLRSCLAGRPPAPLGLIWQPNALKSGPVQVEGFPYFGESPGQAELVVLRLAAPNDSIPDAENRKRFTPVSSTSVPASLELEQARRRLRYQANHDPLTGLPNRALLNDRLEKSLQRARRSKLQIAVLLLDLDEFKIINESQGHETGDKILKQTANRLQARIRAEDTVVRLGGDEFIVLMDSVVKETDAALLADQLLAAIVEPFPVGRREFMLSASIGICVYPRDGDDVATLMRNVDAAMFQAKALGRGRYYFYSQRLTKDAERRVQMSIEIKRALDKNEFLVYYQPQTDLETGKWSGVEALIRWQHPREGLVLPHRFIYLAAQFGLIRRLSEKVLREACEQWVKWNSRGLKLERMAVNLSGHQIDDPNFSERIAAIISESKCPPSRLELEISESYVTRDFESTVRGLRELRKLGVKLSIDDFGAGHSALGYLKKLPLNTLKIDRSFVRDLPSDANDKAVVNSLVILSKSLGLTVVAEGIENVDQETFLRSIGCDFGQGHYYCKPVAADKFFSLAHDISTS